MYKPYPSLTIDLNKIKLNYATIRNFVPQPTKISAVVKANMYGLGARIIAPTLYEAGCREFWTVYVTEGIELRDVLPHNASIYILQGFDKDDLLAYRKFQLIPVINSLHEWKMVQHLDLAMSLFIDTGFSRFGLRQDEINTVLNDAREANIHYILSHLACAENKDHPLNSTQLQNFKQILSKFQQISPNIKGSLSASAGVFLGKEYWFDSIRIAGFILGMRIQNAPIEPSQIITLKSLVLQRYELPIGASIGYGATYKTDKNITVAVISAGYADGIPRALSNKGQIFFTDDQNNRWSAPILGIISMDSLVCDVSNIPEYLTQIGQEATILDNTYDINDMARDTGMGICETLVNIGSHSRRMHKIYTEY